jgi:hypothetical protein
MKEYIIKFNGTEYAFLSNFWESNVDLSFENNTNDNDINRTYQDFNVYRTVEHAYQAAKSLDRQERDTIAIMAKTPGEAKKMGQKVTLRKDWEKIKDGIMLNLLRQKFLKADNLTIQLLSTGNKELIEGNYWHDCYFGVCYCDKCKGRGKNILGQLLMIVRDEAWVLRGKIAVNEACKTIEDTGNSEFDWN